MRELKKFLKMFQGWLPDILKNLIIGLILLIIEKLFDN